jgi:hypothetical protein
MTTIAIARPIHIPNTLESITAILLTCPAGRSGPHLYEPITGGRMPVIDLGQVGMSFIGNVPNCTEQLSKPGLGCDTVCHRLMTITVLRLLVV